MQHHAAFHLDLYCLPSNRLGVHSIQNVIIESVLVCLKEAVADPEGAQGIGLNHPPTVFKYPMKMK